MNPFEITILFFGSMLVCLALGVPISIALGGLAAFLVFFFWGPNALSMMVLKAFGTTSSFEFLSIPLFIFMAAMLEKSGIADDLYSTMYKFFGRLRGGLALGTVVICTIFAAMAGVSAAATVSMGLIALPAMLARGYSKRLALGCIAAGGSLGILIPPSVTMIVYGLVAGVSVGKLYAGGVLPGLLLSALFMIYILLRSYFDPSVAPIPTREERFTLKEKLISLKGLIFPLLLIAGVLGSILTGVASVSEAAAVGALGSMVATLIKGGMNRRIFEDAAETTLLISCLIFWIIIGASAFSTLYTAMGVSGMIKDSVLNLGANRYVVLVMMQIALLFLGMVMDTIGIIMITVPVFVPIVLALGFDPVWFGVLFIINMEIGFLTPPFGYNLFYLKGVAPASVTMGDLYRAVIPFVALMILGLGLCIVFPEIILLLPNLLF
ncbi:MAG: TRAP transporter large permease subunit [Hyphomicrobiaceae bacterium]